MDPSVPVRWRPAQAGILNVYAPGPAARRRGHPDSGSRESAVVPSDSWPVPDTTWDPSLSAAFARQRLVVHEERVMDEELAAHAAGGDVPQRPM